MTSNAPIFSDEYFMRLALIEAQQAADEGEIPIGAVIVTNDKVIARAHNRSEALLDTTAHAELMAITSAQNYLGAKFLSDCTLYVTVEPCVMCAGAIRWARFARVVWGADEPKSGFSRFSTEIFHPKTVISSGILADECADLMRQFFASRR
ncbi:nucleoside deaminase [Porphyromonas sp.]|uniref:nucleoside deaminase n=1 Tax=Porphyromonas sp. TaxID=1924944 RepID=UPI0026DC694E|nr:nucleoside deaminase [Porphyromonas sp.]MDO4771286.1 nucleoside deaminase [Porphyromonas sp.]